MESKTLMVTQLIDAIMRNEPELVNNLIRMGASPNDCLDEDHITPLHYAAQYGSLEAVPVLVHAGADPLAKSFPDGLTPLDIALNNGQQRIAELLIQYLNQPDIMH